ncbi:MAG: hypothetical protein ACPGVU_16625 [Limisphaerales bacterium]
MSDSTNNSASYGWIVMILVAAAAFAGGVYFGKDKRPAQISPTEMAPPQPLPGATPTPTPPSATPPSAPGQPTPAPAPAPAANLLTNAPIKLAPGQPGLLSTQPTPVSGAGSANQTQVQHVSLPITSQPTNGTTIYNGVVIPEAWPPTNAYQPNKIMNLPFLTAPPAVVNVSTGRQLFVDDFIIEGLSNLTRVYHQPVKFTNNPVLAADRDWEKGPGSRLAIPANGGVWWDTTNYNFKMFYRAGPSNGLAMAISTNSTNWSKPLLRGPKSSNIAHISSSEFSTVLLDHHSKDERFKMFRHEIHKGISVLAMHASKGGTNWSKVIRRFGPAPQGSTVFYNPFRGVWVFNLADQQAPGKRRYWEMDDLKTGKIWERLEDAPLWVGADHMDRPQVEFQTQPELQRLDVIPYESLLVGMFTIFKGAHPGPVADFRHNEVYIGFSRDGFHWYRPDRRPWISRATSPQAWDWSDVQSMAGGFSIVGRRLNFSYSARSRDEKGVETGGVGLASIRRDGFVSIDAGPTPGLLLTRPVKFGYAGYMLINMKTNAPDGEVRVAIYSEANKLLQVTRNDDGSVVPFSLENCHPIKHNQTLTSVNWNNIPNISMLVDRPIRFAFQIKNASLYSFWISRQRTGRSEGFSAGGGMHFIDPNDTVGNRSYYPPSYVHPAKRPPKTNSVSKAAKPPATKPAPTPVPANSAAGKAP